MFFFKCVFTEKEFSSLQTTLPVGDFCVVRYRGDKVYCGIIDDSLHGNFMDILSGETLEQLEYLDEEDVRDYFAGRSDYEIVGNRELLKSVL
jgi:hypothetical protein